METDFTEVSLLNFGSVCCSFCPELLVLSRCRWGRHCGIGKRNSTLCCVFKARIHGSTGRQEARVSHYASNVSFFSSFMGLPFKILFCHFLFFIFYSVYFEDVDFFTIFLLNMHCALSTSFVYIIITLKRFTRKMSLKILLFCSRTEYRVYYYKK